MVVAEKLFWNLRVMRIFFLTFAAFRSEVLQFLFNHRKLIFRRKLIIKNKSHRFSTMLKVVVFEANRDYTPVVFHWTKIILGQEQRGPSWWIRHQEIWDETSKLSIIIDFFILRKVFFINNRERKKNIFNICILFINKLANR